MTEIDFLELIGLFYEGILSPQGWREGLQRLATLTSSGAASLLLWNRHQDQVMVADQFGLCDELQKEYQDHFHLHDHGREFADRLALGEWYVDERDLQPARMRVSPFYQDFLRRYTLDSTMAAPLLRAPNGTDGFLSLSGRQGQRDMAHISRQLAGVLPHLQRAACLRLKFLEMSQQLEWGAVVLDRVNFPLLAVSLDGSVMLSNRPGEQWLAAPGNPLARGSAWGRQIKSMLQNACGIGKPPMACGLRIAKPDGAVYYLTAIPLPKQAANPWQQRLPMALLLVSDPGQSKPQAGALLKELFQLSPAEIRLLQPLLQGATLQETARQLHISIDTARTHLKSIFAKLGIRRQADLHRLLGRFEFIDHCKP